VTTEFKVLPSFFAFWPFLRKFFTTTFFFAIGIIIIGVEITRLDANIDGVELYLMLMWRFCSRVSAP
jgi:hypothetical protein